MKWYIGLFLGLSLVFGASVSQGEWQMMVHRDGRVIAPFNLAEIDSVTFHGDMVLIPAGTFTMGSPTSEPSHADDETQHQVTLTKAIYLSTHEVTQSEWQAVMGWNESFFPGANRPVETVTWYDALSYCNQRSTVEGYTPAYTITGATYSGNRITSATVAWNQAADGYRLLTESEWEYACRATSTSEFCNGGMTNQDCGLDPNLDQVGWYCYNASTTTHDVDGKTANAWCLNDMHGNVREWCWDRYGDYPTGTLTDPTGPASGLYRVKRGGDWNNHALCCRSAYRAHQGPGSPSYTIGLRIARNVDASGTCCAPAGTCTLTTQANCIGAWSVGGVCVPNPCLQPDGSCCEANGTCTVTKLAACTGTSTWTMFGDCTPNLCVTLPPPAMVLIPAGAFTMGSPTAEPGRSTNETQHQVTLTDAIYVSNYEVTQSQWQAVMGWNSSYFPGANRPMETVTWYDALSYCNQRSAVEDYTPAYTMTGATYSGNHITYAVVAWNQAANGYRLLTESEWEYACRATSTTAFCNGGITNILATCDSLLDPNLDQVGWYCLNASSTTHDVGGKTANAWGLKDMHGNVWEWCWDWYGPYPTGPSTDPTGPASGTYRVIRGGSYYYYPTVCRSAFRNDFRPWAMSESFGLRVARTAP